MKINTLGIMLVVLLLLLGLMACGAPVDNDADDNDVIVEDETSDESDGTEESEITEEQNSQANIIDIEKFQELVGVYNYKSTELDEVDTVGERLWTETSAMLTVTFRIHPGGGTNMLEDYRTAANPGSRVWVDSSLWDAGIYYEIGEWDADFVVVRGEDCYAVSFVPEAHPGWNPVELGQALMELLLAGVK